MLKQRAISHLREGIFHGVEHEQCRRPAALLFTEAGIRSLTNEWTVRPSRCVSRRSTSSVSHVKQEDTSLRGHFSLPQSLAIISGFFRRIFHHSELIMVLDVKIARRSCSKNEILFEQPAR